MLKDKTIEKVKYREKYDLLCDKCGCEYNYTGQGIHKGRKKYDGGDYCRSCKMKFEIERGERNPSKVRTERNYQRRGKSLEEIYGKETASKIRTKMRNNNSGTTNPMYGKPAAKGAGRGLGGYYKGMHFRSTLELAFIIDCEKKGITIKTAERKEYRVKYLNSKGIERTYFPDFVVGNDIIEIKPVQLFHLNETKNKIKAAKEKFGDRYKIITNEEITPVDDKKLLELFEVGLINPDKNMQRRLNKIRGV